MHNKQVWDTYDLVTERPSVKYKEYSNNKNNCDVQINLNLIKMSQHLPRYVTKYYFSSNSDLKTFSTEIDW